jgi:hypothetical protein
MAATLKPITVRLPEEDLEYARKEAEELGISVGVYLRLMFRQSIRTKDTSSQKRTEALNAFSKMISAEAEEKGYNEEDAVRLAKEARKRLAKS